MTVAEHPFAPEDVMAYVDGDLQPAQEAHVRAHLAECAVCQAVAVDVRGVSRDLARWVVEDAPATLVSSRIDLPRRRPIDRLNAWLWRPGSQLGLGAAMLVVLAWAMTVDRHQGKLLMGPELASSPAPASSPRASEAGASLPLPDDARAMALAVDEVDARLSARTGVARQVPPLPPAAPAIARTARLRLRTGDFDKVRSDVDRVLTELKGWYKEVSITGDGQQNRVLTATLQVPSVQLDDAIRRLKTLGAVDGETLKGEDVGDQIVDVEARLSNARTTETRLLELLQKRTGDVIQVLAAEREIARVREEIERFVARRKSLGDRVTYASLTLEVAEARQATVNLGPEPVGGRFRDAFVTGVGDAVDTAVGLTLFVIRVSPTLLLWALLLFLPVRFAIRWGRRRAAGGSTSSAS